MAKSVLKATALLALLAGTPLLPAVANPPSEVCNTVTAVHAYYSVATRHGGNLIAATEVELIRNATQVAYRRPDLAITEVWEQTPTQRLHLVRYFDSSQRGIEYQPDEIKGNHDWSAKYNLLSQAQRNTMQVVQATGDCAEAEQLVSRQGQASLTSAWLKRYDLPQSLLIEHGRETTEWQLVRIDSDRAEIDSVLAALNGYQTTDYSDIGDSESDPFLRQLINQGFVEHGHSGFYDASGHGMGDGHRH